MLDEELIEAMEKELPTEVPHIFISSVSGYGITELKDLLWTEINKEENRIETFTHRNLEVKTDIKEDDFEEVLSDENISDEEFDEQDFSEDFDEDYKG